MKIIITFLYLFVFNILNSQVDLFDSCGLDESVILNKFEIKVIDSLFLNNSIKSKKN